MSFKDHFPFTVDEGAEGIRIDQFLSKIPESASRSKLSSMIQNGGILVNAKPCKSAAKLKIGDVISLSDEVAFVSPVEKAKQILEYTGPKLEILYEDERLIVLNKPNGLVVHPGAGIDISQTLAGWLTFDKRISLTLGWSPKLLEEQRAGIVHRLDKGTSGTIILAKDPATHEKLSAMFKNREVHRLYWALVHNNLKAKLEKRPSNVDSYLFKGWAALKRDGSDHWSIATHHGRDPKNPLRYRAEKKEGKKAISTFICHSSREADSFVELKLSTGRTHQIRVHMSFLGCPVLGDTLYGAREASRILLHAHRIQFKHPWANKTIDLEASSQSFESFAKVLGYTPRSYDSKFL